MIGDTKYVTTTTGTVSHDVRITPEDRVVPYLSVVVEGEKRRVVLVPVGTKSEVEELRAALNGALDALAELLP